MKRVWKIASRVLLGLLLTVYVAVALVNYSVVQSYLGTAVGHRLSSDWGGTVKIGALHAMPWDHLILNNVLLVHPDGDTILNVERLRLQFKRFPYEKNHLSFDHVYLRNGYYHLAISEDTINNRTVTNLQYIFDHYALDEPKELKNVVFTVDVGTLLLNHVHYKMDLPEIPEMTFDVGVSIAHMEFFDIVSRIRDIHVVNDDVTCRLMRMSTTERSGFEVDHIEGRVHVSPNDITVRDFKLRTPRTTVLAEVEMTYDGWEGMDAYEDNVRHDIELKEGTSVALADAAYWAPWLWGCDSQVEAVGYMKGTVNEMSTSMSMHWGEQSGLLVAGTLHGITEPKTANVTIDIERLRTNLDDLQPLFVLTGTNPKQLPLAQRVEYIDLEGRVSGGLESVSTINLNAVSGIGNLHADALLSPTPTGGVLVNAELGSNGLGLDLLNSDWLSHTGFNISLNGDCADLKKPRTLRANIEGQLLNSVVRGRRLRPVDLEGKLDKGVGELYVQSTDSVALFDLKAKFNIFDSVKSLLCALDVEHLDAEALQIMPEKYGTMHTHAVLQLAGRDLDAMQGELMMNGTAVGDLRVDRLTLTVDADDGDKTIQLQSDPVDATIGGCFGYADLPLMLRQMASEALPRDLFDIKPLTAEEADAIAHSSVDLHMHWKDDGRFIAGLNEGLMVARNTRLTGSYNSRERLKLALRSDSLRMGSVALNDVGFSGRTEHGDYLLRLEAQEVAMGSVELLRQADLLLNSNYSRTLLELDWGSPQSTSRGDVELQLNQRHVGVLKPDFAIGSNPWRLEIDSLMLINDGGFRLAGDGIAFRSAQQYVSARLNLMQEKNDCVELTFNNFDLSGVTGLLLQDSPMEVNGDIGGRFSLYGLGDIPYFNANLTIDSCVVNRQPLGTVLLRSNWNAELNNLNLQLSGEQLSADGWIELGRENGEMNFTVDFDRFELGLVAPLLSEFSNRFEGRLHGNFDITGTTKHPVIVGEALVEEGALQVDVTGVTYFFDDSLQFTNNLVTLRDFEVRDPQGNSAFVDGTINYDDLTDVKLDLALHTDNLLVLDRRQGEDFYGTVLASATGTVSGPLQALQVNVSARTTPGCALTVPVNEQRQVKAQNYITFTSDRPEPARREAQPRKEQTMNLELDLTITPDVQLSLPMDFSEVSVGVAASGSGDLHLSMAGSDEPQVLGNYEIISGTMKVGLISLIEKTFSLESGSSLNFQGSLPDARFDLSAVYSQRVNLSTLTGGLSEGGSTQKYIQVEDVISIAGTLQDPTIGFDIRLPGADASVEEEVFAYIDRNNERDMLNQAVSLLVTGHFYNANATTTAAAGGNIATSGGIGALSSLLTDMVSVVDIDVDYKIGNELTKDQLDVNISKDWGRWYLESTLGYGGESRELQAGDANSAVIDALVGYRLSPLVHLFAYNRTNTNDYTRMDLPYKQGVGLKLTKDFDHWGELFRKNKTR